MRFYLSNATPGLTPTATPFVWNDTSAAVVRELSRTPTGTNVAVGAAETDAGTWDVLLGRFVSPPISTAGTLQGAYNYAFARMESAVAADMITMVRIYVVAGDGVTLRESSLAGTFHVVNINNTTEWATAITGFVGPGGTMARTIACQLGDRIVVEIGYRATNITTTSYTGTMRYGGTAATDLANGDITTDATTRSGWIDLTDAAVDAMFVGQLLGPGSGIASSLAFGAGAATPGPVTLSGTGSPSTTAFGVGVVTPGAITLIGVGIPSAQAFGVGAVALGDAVLIGVGIPSAQAFGVGSVTPGAVTLGGVGMGTVGAFGAGTIIGSLLIGVGVPSAAAFGPGSVVPGPVGLIGVGVPSAAAFGPGSVVQVVTAIGIPTRPPPSVSYELVCVARVQQPAGPPVFLDVDPIIWTGLSYTEELSRPQTLAAGCSVTSLPDSIIGRLRNPATQPFELWLYRNGKLQFAGPALTGQRQGDSLTLNAVGLLGYLQFWFVTADLIYPPGTDQFAIATGLIDHWQREPYGDFGISTSGIAPSGVTREISYLRDEGHPIGQRVEELGRRANGFDVAVDPSSRKLLLSYPAQGVDRSSGEDAVIFDDRNVTSPDIMFSIAPGDLASEAFGVGTGDTTIYSTRSDLDLRARFGRTGVWKTFDKVSEQSTLDAHVQGLVDARGQALLIPGPDVRVTSDSDVDSYGPGDTVFYELDGLLGVAGAFRVRKRRVTVSKTGQETVSLEFV